MTLTIDFPVPASDRVAQDDFPVPASARVAQDDFPVPASPDVAYQTSKRHLLTFELESSKIILTHHHHNHQNITVVRTGENIKYITVVITSENIKYNISKRQLVTFGHESSKIIITHHHHNYQNTTVIITGIFYNQTNVSDSPYKYEGCLQGAIQIFYSN